MRIHILGISGTFMAGIALLAKEAGHEVVGSDEHVYPPMSTQLMAKGITLYNGYEAAHIEKNVDCVIVGNVIRRGNKAMEYVLEQQIPYTSGPEWLFQQILKDRWVLAVSGTHGKTTTSSMLAWILEHAGLQPGFLIGGVPENFGVSARIGQAPFFVIEADEYDCAFFDKRSKFIHYHPKTLILNNLEFDHADIFPNLEAIKQQFHYLIRTVPGNGRIIYDSNDKNLPDVLAKGCWTPTVTFGTEEDAWQGVALVPDGSAFIVKTPFESETASVKWNLLGQHNVSNALAAMAAAHHVGVAIEKSAAALSTFQNVKRRLEIKGNINDITIYDDFAHHPTAIATTLAGLRAKIGQSRLVAVLEFGSFTMKSGVHAKTIQAALKEADIVVFKRPEANWDIEAVLATFSQPAFLYDQVDELVNELSQELKSGDHVVIMSNSGFGGIHQKLLIKLEQEQYEKNRN